MNADPLSPLYFPDGENVMPAAEQPDGPSPASDQENVRLPQEKVEDRDNVSIVTPDSYPEQQ